MKKQIIISASILLFLILATTFVAIYGKGYRFSLERGKQGLFGTGLLVVTSSPDGAEVLINNHLTTATDNTINLLPNEYVVRIQKQGYFPWEKRIKIQKEAVAKAEALLFPTTPKLESLTASGVGNPTVDPTITRLAYTVSHASLRKNGIYILDMTTRPILTLQSASTHIVDDAIDVFSKASLAWSPDGQELIATVSSTLDTPTTYLLKTNAFNANPQDISATLYTIESAWGEQKKEREKAQLEAQKPALRSIISDYFRIVAWSPEETKILYEASTSANLPIIIKPRLIGTDATAEDRSLKKDSIYVYDIREDKNYKILDSLNSQLPLSWFPDNKHLIYVVDKKINIMEYDGKNSTTVYAGPFVDNYIFPSPNGSKLIILTDLGNQNTPPNLYTISLK